MTPVPARRGQCGLYYQVGKVKGVQHGKKLGFLSDSSGPHNTFLSKGTYSCVVVLMVVGQRLWEKTGSAIIPHITLASTQNLSTPVFLQTGSTETGYIFLWPLFESQITKYRLRKNVNTFGPTTFRKTERYIVGIIVWKAIGLFMICSDNKQHNFLSLFVCCLQLGLNWSHNTCKLSEKHLLRWLSGAVCCCLMLK